jgi:protein arginine kinase activator
MKCEVCGLEEAVIHVKQIVDETETELHLCESCAVLKGISIEDNKNDFSINNLLTGLVDIDNKSKIMNKKKQCPKCKLTHEQLQKQVKLGCSECFDVFKEEIDYILEKMYGKYEHAGKYPGYYMEIKKQKKEIAELNKKLQEALKFEHYEEAAEIRDRISELQKKKGRINV